MLGKSHKEVLRNMFQMFHQLNPHFRLVPRNKGTSGTKAQEQGTNPEQNQKPPDQQERLEHVPGTNLPQKTTKDQPMTEKPQPPYIPARLSQPRFGWRNAHIGIAASRNRGTDVVYIRATIAEGIYIALELPTEQAFDLANAIVDAAEAHREENAA